MITRKSTAEHFLRKRSRALQVITLITVLLTLEVATRFFRPPHLNMVRFDPEIGYLMKPNLNVRVTDRESHVTHRLTANSLGFRGTEWVSPKPRGVKRIAVFGDSYVEARAYEMERVFCGQIQRLLNESSTTDRWEVMNLGVSAQNTSSELAVYEKFGKPLEPDIVILCMTLSNDIEENSRELSQGYCVYREFDENGRLIFIPPIRKSDVDVRCHWQFYQWQKAKMQTAIDYFRNMTFVTEVCDPLRNTRRNKLAEARGVTKQPLDEAYVQSWKVTRKLLEIFRNEAEENGSRFCIVSIPNAWQVHQELFEMMRHESPDPEAFDIAQPSTQLAEITDELGIELLDLIPAFRQELAEFKRQAPGESGEDLLFLNGIGHFSERGHTVVAREVFRYLNPKVTPESVPHAVNFAEAPSEKTLRQ